MADYLKSPSKSSLLAMLKQASSITPKFMRSLLDGVAFKSDLAKLNQDNNQQTSKYIYSSTVGGILNFKRDWEDLTDGGDTTLHGHDVTGLTGWIGPYVETDGTSPLTGNWDVGNYKITNIKEIQCTDIKALTFLRSDTITEYSADAGVTVDSVLLKDGVATLSAQFTAPIATQTTATLAPNGTHYTILCDGTSNTVTINLPTASGITGRIYVIKAINIDNAVTVSPNGSEEIDGSNSDITLALMEIITVQSDGSNWWII